MDWKTVKPDAWQDNIFRRVADDWMLICVGDAQKTNVMTASFGSFGTLFFKPVAHIYVRPERFTYSLLEKSDSFSLCFFNGENYRKALQYCGKASGRDEDKIAHCGLTAQFIDGTPVIAEADVNIICRKIYRQDIDPELLLDASIKQRTYPGGDTHRMYIGEILKILQK